MSRLEDQWRLIHSLSRSEKRFVGLLGKVRAGKKGSQQIELFEALGAAKAFEDFKTPPSLVKNLSTLSFRLNELILEGLRILQSEQEIDLRLNKYIDNITLLVKRNLYAPAMRRLKKGKKLAREYSRYNHVLEMIRLEREIYYGSQEKNLLDLLESLRQEERELMVASEGLMELRHRHEWLRFNLRPVSVPRTYEEIAQLDWIPSSELVAEHLQSDQFLERSYAISIMAIYYLYTRQPDQARELFLPLIRELADKPVWLADQSLLFLRICRSFQVAVLSGKVGLETTREYLDLIPDFVAMNSQTEVAYKRVLFHNRFNLALNTGDLEMARSQASEILAWMKAAKAHLPPNDRQPFYHNFSVMEFLDGNFSTAYKHVLWSLNLDVPRSELRENMLDFARVLQVILQYELGNFMVNENLARSGKRHFRKNPRLLAFETAVIKCLERMMFQGNSTSKQNALVELNTELEDLAGQSKGGIPLLGLSEVQFWVESKLQGIPIREVFLKAVQENLESLKDQ